MVIILVVEAIVFGCKRWKQFKCMCIFDDNMSLFFSLGLLIYVKEVQSEEKVVSHCPRALFSLLDMIHKYLDP